MASLWRRMMLYLGLGSDDEYDDGYDPPPEQGRARPRADVGLPDEDLEPPAPRTRVEPSPMPQSNSVRTLPPRPSDPTSGRDSSAVRTIPATKPLTVAPVSFNEAKDVADHFKAGNPVIVSLQGADRDLARRLIDFASGLCYGLGGHMEKVANQVYLLTPASVSAEDRKRLQEQHRAGA